MKIVLALAVFLLSVAAVRAADESDPYEKYYYVEHRWRDAGGTVWSFNTEIEPADAACLDCEASVDCSYEEADCEEYRCVTVNGQRVRMMEKNLDVQEPSATWIRPGGLEGYGADGGTFDRQGTFSMYRSWWYSAGATELPDWEQEAGER